MREVMGYLLLKDNLVAHVEIVSREKTKPFKYINFQFAPHIAYSIRVNTIYNIYTKERHSSGFISNNHELHVGELYCDAKGFDYYCNELVVRFLNIPNNYSGTYWKWHPNGSLEEQGQMVKGRKCGVINKWYPNMNKHLECAYHNGVMHGPINEWYENGILRKTGYYGRGGKNGLWLYYHKNGQILSKGCYHGSFRCGKWLYWYSNGKLLAHGKYKSDIQIGKWIYYYENGNKAVLCRFANKINLNKLPNFYLNPFLNENLRRSDYNGLCEEWYENGSGKKFTKFVKGQKHGIEIEWSDERKIVRNVKYHKGVMIQ